METRTMLIDALIKVVMLLITAVIVPEIRAWLIRNKENKTLQIIMQLADVAVRSVENDLKGEAGEKKKSEAVNRLTGYLLNKGISITHEEISHYIETACIALWNEEPFKILKPPEVLNSEVEDILI